MIGRDMWMAKQTLWTQRFHSIVFWKTLPIISRQYQLKLYLSELIYKDFPFVDQANKTLVGQTRNYSIKTGQP